jgi:hypothetical protein
MSTNRRSATAGLALAVTGIVIGALLLLFTVIGFATSPLADDALSPAHVLPLVVGLAMLVPGIVYLTRTGR